MEYVRPLGMSIAIAVALVGCERKVTLAAADGSVRLSYACDEFVPQVVTDAQQAVLLDHAVRIVRAAAANDGMDPVMPLIAAADSGAYDQLEALVIAHLCAHREIAPHVVEIDSYPRAFPARGSTAPTFALPLVTKDGLTDSLIRLDAHHGQPVLVYFWATWCGPCHAKHDEMVALAREFEPRGIAIYGVLTRDSATAAASWLRERGSYSVLYDGDGAVAQAYQVVGIPRMYLLGPEGEVVGMCMGCQWGTWHPDSLRARLDSLSSIEAR